MKHVSVARRLLIGAVGIVIGTLGSAAPSTPAYAQTHDPETRFADTCEGVEVTLISATVERHTYNWTVTVDDAEVFETSMGPGEVLDPPYLARDAEYVHVKLERSGVTGYHKWTWDHTWQQPGGCPPPARDDDPPSGDQPTNAPAPPPPHTPADSAPPAGPHEPTVTTDPTRSPPAEYGISRLMRCDALIVALHNDSATDTPLNLSLTPNRDTIHGDASAYAPLLDADPDPDGDYQASRTARLAAPQEIDAGTPVRIGPVQAGGTTAHGFAAVAGLVVTAELTAVRDEAATVLETTEIVWRPDESSCPGVATAAIGGSERSRSLPGGLPGLIAASALGLLILSGALFLLDRRRRAGGSRPGNPQPASGPPAN